MSCCSTRSSPIAAGEVVADFTLKDQDRNDWNLAANVKNSEVVLCFFPLAFTSVCSTEMKCVNDEMAKWKAKGSQVVGISCDSFATLKAWADQMGLKQTLLADMHRTVCKSLGLYWSDLNVSTRATVVVGKNPEGVAKVKWVQSRQPGNAMNWEEVLAHIS